MATPAFPRLAFCNVNVGDKKKGEEAAFQEWFPWLPQ